MAHLEVSLLTGFVGNFLPEDVLLGSRIGERELHTANPQSH